MTKFADELGTTPRTGSSPVQSTTTVVKNHGGANALAREAKSDLFLLGVSNFVGEDTYYETAEARDNRFERLVREVTQADPDWVLAFIPWLRNEANMRSVSIVTAVEYVRAGGHSPAQAIDSACSRADEPAEVLAYWIARYGRPVKSSVKRGVAKAAQRLYNERSLLKYDGNSKTFRFADVIQLVHPRPQDRSQDALFKFALDSRYGNTPDFLSISTDIPIIKTNKQLTTGMPPADARARLVAKPPLLKAAGMTWEQLSGFGPMDAEAWEAVIPSMGYMALLRNLRNFDEQGVSDAVAAQVAARLSDPDEVAKSRQLPFRFWSAFKNTHSFRWAQALETALGHSLKNIPTFGGRTLLLVDTSHSMTNSFSAKSQVCAADAAALFGAALTVKGEGVDWYGWADRAEQFKLRKGTPVLQAVKDFRARQGRVGYGTNLPGAMRTYDGHDRVIIISDMQTLGRYDRNGYYDGFYERPAVHARGGVPPHVPVFAFNISGYAQTQVNSKSNEHELGGLTDQTFKLIPLIERRQRGGWPWED